MKQRTKIGNFEAACLLLNMIASKIILDFPRVVSENAGTAGWLMVLLVSVVVFLLFLFISRLYRIFVGKDLLDVSEMAFGNFGRIIIGIIFLIQFTYMTHVALREFAEDIKVISLTATPISIVILFFCIGMIIGAYLGLETLARLHVLAIPILAVAFTLILLFNIPRFDISRLSPWLGLGVNVILQKGVINLSIFSEIVVLFFVLPYLNKKNDYGGIGRYGILFSGFFFVMTSMCYLLIYQYPTSTEFFLPAYQMARSIKVGRFFTRIESGFILIWASSAFLYLSSGLYFITYIFQKTFSLKYRRPLIIPFIILLFALSMVPENLFSTLQIEMEIYRSFSWIITLVLPIILLIIAKIRVRFRETKEAQGQ